MILREKAKDDRGRVTAGLPSLSSEKRHTITDQALLKIYQDSLVNQYAQNEKDALAADGAIDDTTDMEKVVGIPLMGGVFLTRLKRLNKSLWFEPSKADTSKTGIYLLKNDFKGGLEKEYIVGIETEWNPEFTLRVTDKEGNAKGILPGWRRALTRLIRAKLINEAAAFKLFGPPSRDSENWARYTT